MTLFRFWRPMDRLVFTVLLGATTCGDALSGTPDVNAQITDSGVVNSRLFEFRYAFALHDLPEGSDVRVWLPLPKSDAHQDVSIVQRQLPAKPTIHTESQYGNKVAYFRQSAPRSGELSVAMTYRVRRREIRGLQSDKTLELLSREQLARYLVANRMVPIAGKPLELLADVELPADKLSRARAIYELVDQHVRYDKSKPGYGNGDVLWVCDSRFGNCTDFHSLFLSLARANGLPARFEIGFPLPPDRGQGSIGGYHCWAKFYDDKLGWVPVDISEADKHPELRDYYFGNLTPDRITFTAGRDITLVPQQNGPPLNYFVYPYVEVDGMPWPSSKIELDFRYEDQPPSST